MITHEAEGQTWTLNLVVCVPVYLTDEEGAALPGVRLDVAPSGLHTSLEPYTVHPTVRRHHYGPGATAIFAANWGELFAPGSPIWRPLEEGEAP